MHFRHISAKIQLKHIKQHFDWEEGGEEALGRGEFEPKISTRLLTTMLLVY